MSREFDFALLVELCERTHREMQLRAARTVDHLRVVCNWVFGWYIEEFENDEAERSELYRRTLIGHLSGMLRDNALKSYSPANLQKFREVYHALP